MMTEMNRYEEFLATIPSIKSQRVYKSYSPLGEFDYTDCDIDLVEKAILSVNPKSIKSITTACNTLKKYAEFLGDTHLITLVDSIDRKELWEKIKPKDLRKFISYRQYKEICHDINVYEEYNSLYYKTLFMALYEGIYSNDLSVVKNLRVSDIRNDGVILRPDNGEEYFLGITKELIHNLIELSEVDTWDQAAKSGYIQMQMIGKHFDSCFKTVSRARGNNINEMRFYQLRLRKIADNYVEYPLKPSDLFVSGIVHRIIENLKDEGITLREAFRIHIRVPKVREIFLTELNRCKYPNAVRNFRELVESYLDVFLEQVLVRSLYEYFVNFEKGIAI